MQDEMKTRFTDLLSVRRGHFALESGLHGDVWFDLEPVFVRPSLLQPYADRLGELLAEHELSAVCGALVGGAFVAYSIATRLGIDFFYAERHVRSLTDGIQTVEYRLPRSVRSGVANRRIGVIDDVINAGSAVTKTCDDLRSLGADPVVLASILTVGGLSPKRLPGYPQVASLEHLQSNLWDPRRCPLCHSGVPLVDPYDGAPGS